MMTKEGFTKIANCMTLRVGVVVLWCGHSGDTAKEPQCRVPDTQVICCPAREIYFSHGDVIFAIEVHLPPLCSGTPAVKHDLGFSVLVAIHDKQGVLRNLLTLVPTIRTLFNLQLVWTLLNN